MGFNNVPHKPYCIIKEGVVIFFYMDSIVFIFRKNKTENNKESSKRGKNQVPVYRRRRILVILENSNITKRKE